MSPKLDPDFDRYQTGRRETPGTEQGPYRAENDPAIWCRDSRSWRLTEPGRGPLHPRKKP